MRITVGPARRPGKVTEIYDRTLTNVDLSISADGEVTLTFEAHGVNCQKSLYRYRVHLTASEKDNLAEALKGT